MTWSQPQGSWTASASPSAAKPRGGHAAEAMHRREAEEAMAARRRERVSAVVSTVRRLLRRHSTPTRTLPTVSPTRDDAAALAAGTRRLVDRASADQGHWPHEVAIVSVEADVIDDDLVAMIRYETSTRPGMRLGAAFTVSKDSWFWRDDGLDADWAASHVIIYFGEATFAGGDPSTHELDDAGVRWYRDTLL